MSGAGRLPGIAHPHPELTRSSAEAAPAAAPASAKPAPSTSVSSPNDSFADASRSSVAAASLAAAPAGFATPTAPRSRSAHKSGRPTGAATTVGQLQGALRRLDPAMRESLYGLLNDAGFARFLLDNPAILERAGGFELAALSELASHMPEGSPLREELELVVTAAGGASLLQALGIGSGPEGLARRFGVNLRALRMQLRQVSGALRALGRDAAVRAAIDVALESGVRPGELLRAIEDGSVAPGTLKRLLAARPTAGDVLTIMRVLRDSTSHRILSIDLTSAAARTISVRLGIPVGAFTRMTFGPGDTLQVKTGSADVLQSAHLPTLLADATLHFDISELERNGVRLSTQIAYGTALKALFTESLTGSAALDVLLRTFMVLLLPLTLLFVALSSRRADVDIRDGRAQISVDLLFGRMNRGSVRTDLAAGGPSRKGSDT